MQLERSNRELVDAKAMLEHANAELERGNRELDEFAYAVSHDLRSPLRAIQNLASWIREDAGKTLGEEPRAWLDEIPDRVARMDRLLEDLLAYSRAIRAPSGFEETEFGELVSSVVRILDVPTGFDVRVFGRELHFYTRRAPLQQVLNNLIQNAVNHHDEKSGTVTVTARHGDAGMLEIEVADDGPGIPPHLRERAFGLFRSMSRKDGGSGLGLALARRVVENQGGTIGVRDNDPRGAVFHFTWPIRVER
jgi:signal transduction histidine kinase